MCHVPFIHTVQACSMPSKRVISHDPCVMVMVSLDDVSLDTVVVALFNAYSKEIISVLVSSSPPDKTNIFAFVMRLS